MVKDEDSEARSPLFIGRKENRREKRKKGRTGKRGLVIRSSKKWLKSSCRRGKLKKKTIEVDLIVETIATSKKADSQVQASKACQAVKAGISTIKKAAKKIRTSVTFTGQRHCRRQKTPSTHILVHHQGTSLTITSTEIPTQEIRL
ncbi:uncharacterized protein LOC113331903 [Papaver somniferum]|uniref:uncharacterized protein LOC113331903 n=1 Tax=Papaver somniferum TaxID=3469 RepID=UPI000E6FD34D|nr:uncharacterized protein LOC113331903 [Papaver somniferum]